MTIEKTCEWRTCERPPDSGHPSLCILHNPDPGKDVALFNQTLEEKIRNDEEGDAERIDLSGVVFPDVADFRGRVFPKEISFRKSSFLNDAIFRDVEFKGTADFWHAEFNGYADFFRANFFYEVAFFRALFHKGANFTAANFLRYANFISAGFDRRADFLKAHFGTQVSFDSADMRGTVDFAGAKFDGEASFVSAHFAGFTRFKETLFNAKTNFPFCQMSSQVRFEECNLAKVSLAQADVSRVAFIGCTWPRIERYRWVNLRPLVPSALRNRFDQSVSWLEGRTPMKWGVRLLKTLFLNSGNTIYDEFALHQGATGSPILAQVAEAYRQLRLNYESTRQEIEAGDFYIGQMEMRRLDATYDWHYRWMLAVYRLLGLYGESYVRPFLLYLLFVAPVFALGYWWLGTETYGDGVFAALTAGRLFTAIPTGVESWEKMLVYANMVLDILLLTLTVIALRRKFQR